MTSNYQAPTLLYLADSPGAYLLNHSLYSVLLQPDIHRGRGFVPYSGNKKV